MSEIIEILLCIRTNYFPKIQDTYTDQPLSKYIIINLNKQKIQILYKLFKGNIIKDHLHDEKQHQTIWFYLNQFQDQRDTS